MISRFAPALYLLLLVLAVPWYWPAGTLTVWFGMPAWVVVAILVSTAASVLTAVLLARPWPDESDENE